MDLDLQFTVEQPVAAWIGLDLDQGAEALRRAELALLSTMAYAES